MPRAEARIAINRSPEDVFAFVTDIRETPRWRRPHVLEADWLDEGEARVGARFRIVREFHGRRVDVVCEITAWEPPNRFAYRMAEGPVDLEAAYQWEPQSGGCRFTIVGADPAVVKWYARQTRQDLQTLKNLLENRAGGHAASAV
ncbi:MAG: SRPBCC family protein [Egibacteraceae bacterium]